MVKNSIKAANSFSFLKGHMSDQVSILVGQNRNVVGRFLLLFLSGRLFEIIIFLIVIYLLFGQKNFDQGLDFVRHWPIIVGHWPIIVGHCPMTDSYLQL